MLDDLDLAWEESQDGRRRGQPPSRQQRQRRRKEAKRRRRSFSALIIAMLMLVVLGGGVYWGVGWVQDTFGAADYETNPAKVPVNVVVHEGDGASQIASELFNKKVVKSAKAFVNAAAADPEKSKGIQPGTYKLFQEMPANIALAMLLDPGKNMLVNKVTIPEGMIAQEIYAKLSKASGIPVADFAAAAKDPVKLGVSEDWFTAKRDDKTPVLKSIEGFLFPATYSFQPHATAAEMLTEMVSTFNSTIDDLKFKDTAQSKLSITPYEALIAASIAEKEAVFPEDFAKVARVLYNRAYTDASPCDHCLGLDSTVNYWLDITGKGSRASEHLTQAQLDDLKNPYNTHRKPGMPPGAISNPGKAALAAALAPVGSSKVVYFVSIDKAGHMAYAETEAQRIANNNLACKNGIPIC